MNTLRAGSTVHYLARPDWGLGKIRWVTPAGLLHVRFEDGAGPVYEGEFAALELSDAAPLEVPA